jgi:hypothetical protein
MRRFAFYIVVVPSLSLCACVHTLAAPGPIVTDRPDQTEGTGLVAPGWTQLEAGMTAYVPSRRERSQSLGEGLLRYRVLPRLEARADIPSIVLTSGAKREFGDGGLGIKTPLLIPAEGASRAVPALSLLASTSVSTNWSRGPALETPEIILASSWEFSDRVGLAANVVGRPFASRSGDMWEGISLSGGFDLTERLGSYAEAYNLGTPAVNTGLTYRLTPNFQVDGRIGVSGYSDRDRIIFFGVGFGTRW